MTSRKIIGRVPIAAAPNPKQIDELTPFGRKLMYVLNTKKYKKYAHSHDIEYESINKPNIKVSPISAKKKWTHVAVTVDGGKRNKRQIDKDLSLAEDIFKIDCPAQTALQLEDVQRRIVAEPLNARKCCINLPDFVNKTQQRSNGVGKLTADRKRNSLANQFEKCLNIGDELHTKTRIFEKKIRIEEHPINYYAQGNVHEHVEKKQKTLSVESAVDVNRTKYLTGEKYCRIKDWCNSQPFDNFREIGFEQSSSNENEKALDSSSEDLDDFTRLIMKKPKIKILDIKYLKEDEKLKIQTNTMKRDPVIFLDRIVKADPKRGEMQSKITSILKCNNNNKQIILNDNLVVKKNFKQQKITELLKKR